MESGRKRALDLDEQIRIFRHGDGHQFGRLVVDYASQLKDAHERAGVHPGGPPAESAEGRRDLLFDLCVRGAGSTQELPDAVERLGQALRVLIELVVERGELR